MWKQIALMVLSGLLKKLSSLDEKKIGEITVKLNNKIDIPGVSEETEGVVIRAALVACVKTAKELVSIL